MHSLSHQTKAAKKLKPLGQSPAGRHGAAAPGAQRAPSAGSAALWEWLLSSADPGIPPPNLRSTALKSPCTARPTPQKINRNKKEHTRKPRGKNRRNGKKKPLTEGRAVTCRKAWRSCSSCARGMKGAQWRRSSKSGAWTNSEYDPKTPQVLNRRLCAQLAEQKARLQEGVEQLQQLGQGHEGRPVPDEQQGVGGEGAQDPGL